MVLFSPSYIHKNCKQITLQKVTNSLTMKVSKLVNSTGIIYESSHFFLHLPVQLILPERSRTILIKDPEESLCHDVVLVLLHELLLAQLSAGVLLEELVVRHHRIDVGHAELLHQVVHNIQLKYQLIKLLNAINEQVRMLISLLN